MRERSSRISASEKDDPTVRSVEIEQRGKNERRGELTSFRDLRLDVVQKVLSSSSEGFGGCHRPRKIRSVSSDSPR